MWRHIPKIVVLSAIGLLVLTVYFTQWNGAPAGEKGPPVVYIDQGFGTQKSPTRSP
jgi:hypothetical protein